jgi:glutamine synthetase
VKTAVGAANPSGGRHFLGRGDEVTPKEVLALCREKEVKAVDFRFMDFPGLWQHFTIPVSQLKEDTFEDGLGFDGSSIRGWQAINESDMLVVPQPETAFLDPFTALPTLVMICNIQDPITREDYSRDPRNVARKAVNYLKSSGVADTAFFGPEAEFFIFDDIRFDQRAHEGYYHIDSVEGEWNRGRDEKPNLGYKIRHKEGYFPVPPTDQLMDIRNEMMQTMIDCGLDVETQHHEVATAGQAEIDLKFQELVRMADQMLIYKYIIKNVAKKHGKTATFMPKPLYGDNGSGMHCHFSLWKENQPLFAGSGYAGLSDMGLYAIGGLLKHAAAVLQAIGAGLRSAGEPGLLATQSLGGLPHPDVQPQPQGQASRIPLPGSELQSVSGVRRDHDGGPGRHPEQDSSRRSAGQGYLRSASRRGGGRAQDARRSG